MTRIKTKSDTVVCDQCGIPYGKGGVEKNVDGNRLHFCCYGCSFTHAIVGEHGESGTASLFLIRLGFSALLSMNVMLFSWVFYAEQWHGWGIEPEAIPYVGMFLFVISTPVIFLVGYPFFRNGIRELMSRHLSMDSLIALGSLAAYGYSTYEVFTGGDDLYFDTATMIIVLVTFGRYIEATAKVRSTNAIQKLLDIVPDNVRLIRNGDEETVSSKEVPVGSCVRILPGEYVPLDGIIESGETSVNESILTGEPVPHSKAPGDEVFAGTVNIDGSIVVRTTTVSEETVHARIVRLMEEAQMTRSPLQKMVDRISGIFIPLVISIAIITFTAWLIISTFDRALMYALAVLVVACPCALGIGSPIAAAVAIGRSAANGILIKSTGVMERVGKTKIAVFDKTGTLTRGEFTVTDVYVCGVVEEFLSVISSLEYDSIHPLSKGILNHARAKLVKRYQSRNMTNVPGKGIYGDVRIYNDWKQVYVGSIEFLLGNDMELPDCLKTIIGNIDGTVVCGGWDGEIKGIIGLSDTLHESAHQAIQLLHQMNITTVLLSGDRVEIAERIGKQLGIGDIHGRFLPRDKIDHIRALREKTKGVTMVGDGINDAPSLAAADTGITLASATDIAKENADIAILGHHLDKIPWIIKLSNKTRRIISWNLIWAFGYNSIALLFAAFGFLQPIIAAFAMILSSLLVIGNSMRLKAMKI
jgi:heavy metal translocating P-type ATPase